MPEVETIDGCKREAIRADVEKEQPWIIARPV